MDDSQKDKNWQKIKVDLGSAVADWDRLCQNVQGPSQEEKQLQEIRSLLSKLTEKLEEF